MEKPDCYYYDNLTGGCKKGLPGTRCEIEGCVAYFPYADGCFIHKAIEKHVERINATLAGALVHASRHLSERVDQYLVQGCSRAELKAANDALKKLMELRTQKYLMI